MKIITKNGVQIHYLESYSGYQKYKVICSCGEEWKELSNLSPYWFCPSCGREIPLSKEEKRNKIEIIQRQVQEMVDKNRCPKCGGIYVFYLQKTNAAHIEQIAVIKTFAKKDAYGHVISEEEHPVPGRRIYFDNLWKCNSCGYEEHETTYSSEALIEDDTY